MKCLANDGSAKAIEKRIRLQTIEFYAVLFAYTLVDKY